MKSNLCSNNPVPPVVRNDDGPIHSHNNSQHAVAPECPVETEDAQEDWVHLTSVMSDISELTSCDCHLGVDCIGDRGHCYTQPAAKGSNLCWEYLFCNISYQIIFRICSLTRL